MTRTYATGVIAADCFPIAFAGLDWDGGNVLGVTEQSRAVPVHIDLARVLWRGGQHFQGHHYTYDVGRSDLAEVGAPVQRPIPIWVVGLWPRPRSMRRVLRCDGVMPQYDGDGSPARMREMCEWLSGHGVPDGFDVLAEGETPPDDPATAASTVVPWADAGATWWLETRWEMPHHSPARMREVRERLLAGPPRIGERLT
jgi:hypothetical protein